MEANNTQEYYVLPLWSSYTLNVKRSKAKNGDENLNENTDSNTNEESVDMEDQVFLEELERLKRQEKEATDASETLRKTFAQSTEDLLLQAGSTRANSTTFVNIATTPLNASSTPTNQDDSQIPALEDIYDHSRDGIFTSALIRDLSHPFYSQFIQTVVGCSREQWEWQETRGLGFSGMAGKCKQLNSVLNVGGDRGSTIMEFTLLVLVVNRDLQ
nr:hypothetical protein [Tanacetum cinerariifolium]